MLSKSCILPVAAAYLLAACAAADITSGAHTLSGRSFHLLVPATTPAPVLICLHGNGGTGAPMLDSVASSMPSLAAKYILVAPDGPSSSWNIKAEASSQDDQLYVGATLVAHLATFDNVDASSFTLYGYSNGAALANRILIENDDPRITAGITDGSQLNTFQYHASNFYVGGESNAYTTVKTTLTNRRLLQMVGELDDVIPAAGGASSIPDGSGGEVIFVPWRDSAYHYAQAYGYTGSAASLTPDDATMAKAEYLGGDVVAIVLKAGGHVAGPSEPLAQNAIFSFLDIPVPPGGSGLCTSACSTEFIDGCIGVGGLTYTKCRDQMADAGSQLQLSGAGCVAECTDTAEMAALKPEPDPDPKSNDDDDVGGSSSAVRIAHGLYAFSLSLLLSLAAARA